MPYRTQQQLLLRPFTQENEPGFQQPIKGETGTFLLIMVGKTAEREAHAAVRASG